MGNIFLKPLPYVFKFVTTQGSKFLKNPIDNPYDIELL